MDKDIRTIFESYQGSWDITPGESFKRDKEFFEYVIENNDHLAPLKNIKIKYIFELYKTKLREMYDIGSPGLVNENTQLSNKQAFDILQESTKSVSDRDAYESVKTIFESICADILLYESDILLEQTGRVAAGGQLPSRRGGGLSPAQQAQVARQQAAAPGAAKPKRKRDYAAEYARRKELEAQRAQAAGQPGETVTDTVTTDTEVAIPASRNVAQPNAAQIKQQQQIRDQEAQIKKLQAQQGQPTAAQIKQQQQMRDMQDKNDQLAKTIQDMEAKEAEMSAQQKAQSDAQQEQMRQQMQMFSQLMQQMANQQKQGAQAQAQAAATDQGLADRMSAAARGPVKDVEEVKDTETVSASAPVPPKKPGVLSRLAKGALPLAGAALGGAAGSLLGPAGTIGGAALGKALGGAAKTGLEAPKGQRAKSFFQAPVGKHALGGAVLGTGAEAMFGSGGEEAVDTAVETPAAPLGTAGAGMDYSDTADMNNPEVQATMQQYADSQPRLMDMGQGTPTAGTEEISDTETETEVEAPYGINPNTGEPFPEPRGQVKGGQRLMQMSRR